MMRLGGGCGGTLWYSVLGGVEASGIYSLLGPVRTRGMIQNGDWSSDGDSLQARVERKLRGALFFSVECWGWRLVRAEHCSFWLGAN